MKQLLTYSLLFLVLYAFNYKTISYCMKSTGSICEWSPDYDCEKEDAEPEKSEKNEKEEKKDISEFLSLHRIHSITIIHALSFSQQSKLLFIPADFSKAVYSPPEPSSFI